MRALFCLIILTLFAAPAAALELPARKPGLWQLNMNFENRNVPAQVIKHCIDAATDKQMNSMSAGMANRDCSKQDVRQVGGTIVVDSVCRIGGMTTTSHAVVSGDFSSAYTVQVESKTEGGPTVPGVSGNNKMMIAAKWLGACEAGQKPGDMIMANGFKMNINQVPQAPMMPGGAPRMPPR